MRVLALLTNCDIDCVGRVASQYGVGFCVQGAACADVGSSSHAVGWHDVRRALCGCLCGCLCYAVLCLSVSVTRHDV